MRDLKQYQQDYLKLSFEEHHVRARKRILLEQFRQKKPSHVIEIGCGLDPLGAHLDEKIHYTLIEPASEFYHSAMTKLEGIPNVLAINSTFEQSNLEDLISADFVVVSCLLHELQDRGKFLRKLSALFSMLEDNAVCHINVPNANSLHRKLAVKMGLVDKVDTPSETQTRMQQSGIVYDLKTLSAEMSEYGFKPIADGGILLKPFTHDQMFRILEKGILQPSVVMGLEELGAEMKEISSEIWVNFRHE